MPITFEKSALITAAREAITGHEKAEAKWEVDKAAYIAAQAEGKDMLPVIRALRDRLTAFLKTGRQPTREDARSFRVAAGHDYLHEMYVPGVTENDLNNNVPKPSGWLYRNKADSYRGLIKMLEANTEDTITANQLKLFGYTDLELLFRRAAEVTPPDVSE